MAKFDVDDDELAMYDLGGHAKVRNHPAPRIQNEMHAAAYMQRAHQELR